ncbi:hypothetical protein AHMF7616_05223 [Adhaeribacter pallidiroseus]|uniref:SnoaL-like domain-containing protein n=2 Tax=Adhaeribacter pallidiroseus TaxID=2072847 RepID=A0A369Q2F9_9BACT|nr:hypothetical protein AHMF7616_05326 [Adhaeribacter pallidiroseus]RDC58789.1 hypothetical protein AHMF7616_05223 [Adhaeribacter pallidiroseus]
MKKSLIILVILVVLNSCNNQIQLTMDTKNMDVVKQYFEHFNNHDWEKMAEMYSETTAFKDPSLGQGIVKQTREQIAQKYSELNEAFPDLKDDVIQVYPSGENHIIVEFVSSGTAPDDSKLELPICTIFTIENGKIVKDFTYYDNFEE